MSEKAVPTQWETTRFGEQALPLRRAIWRGLQAAHQRALAAHKGLGPMPRSLGRWLGCQPLSRISIWTSIR
jgi:hypothetical protein